MRTRSSQEDKMEEDNKLEPVERSVQVARIGIYGVKERKELVERYLEKRRRRCWKRTIKYGVRKTFADSRMRVKGRFISKQDQTTLREALLDLL